MFGTFLTVMKFKEVITSVASTVGGAGSILLGKKKKSLQVIEWVIKTVALFTSIALAMAVLVPTADELENSKTRSITLTEEQRKSALEAIRNGEGVTWEKPGNDVYDRNKNTPATISTNYVLPHDVSKLSDLDIQRLKEYVAVCEEVANDSSIPVWAVMAINTLEGGTKQLGDSGVYVGTAAFDKKGLSYGSIGSAGKVINYTNYGKAEIAKDGDPYERKYKGPFQIDTDYGASDSYNFVISGKAAIKSQENRLKIATDYFDGVTSDPDIIWAVTICMHNTGEGGFCARVPKENVDARKHFVDTMFAIQKTALFEEVGREMITVGWSDMGVLSKMFQMFDGLPNMLYSEEIPKEFSFTPTSPIYSKGSPSSCPGIGYSNGKYGIWKGDGNGTTSENNGFKVHKYPDKAGCVIGKVGDTEYGWEFDYEALRYLLGGFTKGKYIENTCRAAIKELGTGAGPTDGVLEYITRPYYYWRDSEEVSLALMGEEKPVEGLYNEVGKKGTFPLFIQGSRLNEVSKTPWKFAGGETTIGASGCSLFALTSLIHGVGYGERPIPITTNGTDGTNSQGYICLQEMARAIPNGPVLADDVSALGYIVKTVPTDEEGLEILFSYLEKGVPFVVNVRYGDITGYDRTYKPHTVHFTNEGHFIVLVGGFRLNGKRYVEVVQSTYSNGGLAKCDQNDLVFDFDEMKNKHIIRSSGGNCVPAYTITGIKDSAEVPNYEKIGYKAPTRVDQSSNLYVMYNPTEQADISVNTMISDIKETGYIRLLKPLYVNVEDNYIDIYVTSDRYLRIKNAKISSTIYESMEYEEGTYIGEITEDTTFEHYVGDVLVTQ